METTETVYGLGANGLDTDAMDKIYAAKGRPSDNPLILHVPNAESIKPLVKEIPETAKALIEAFWPGPLTITLPKSDLVPDRATGGLNRVALRCPDHAVCRNILELCPSRRLVLIFQAVQARLRHNPFMMI